MILQQFKDPDRLRYTLEIRCTGGSPKRIFYSVSGNLGNDLSVICVYLLTEGAFSNYGVMGDCHVFIDKGYFSEEQCHFKGWQYYNNCVFIAAYKTLMPTHRTTRCYLVLLTHRRAWQRQNDRGCKAAHERLAYLHRSSGIPGKNKFLDADDLLVYANELKTKTQVISVSM